MANTEPSWRSRAAAAAVNIAAPVRVRADLHVHTRYSSDGAMSPSELLAVAHRRGLTCLAVTDHNTISGARELLGNGLLQIIVGEEIRTSAGEITGLFLQEPVPKDLSPVETVKLIKAQGGLVYIPHPFDRLRGSVLRRKALEEVLPFVDIIEAYNSRNTLPQDSARALAFARHHNLIVGGGSDAHIPYEVGRTVVEMPAFDGPEEFLRSLEVATIISRQSPFAVHFASGWVKFWRRLRR